MDIADNSFPQDNEHCCDNDNSFLQENECCCDNNKVTSLVNEVLHNNSTDLINNNSKLIITSNYNKLRKNQNDFTMKSNVVKENNKRNYYKPDLSQMLERLKTFSDLALSCDQKEILAKYGFYYLKYSHFIKCYYCYTIFFDLESINLQGIKQDKHRYNCPIIQNGITETTISHCSRNRNIPSGFKNVTKIEDIETNVFDDDDDNNKPIFFKYCSLEDRLATFNNSQWLENYALSLAEVGFYYTNYFDWVKCFWCEINLLNWNKFDDPYIQHLKYSSDCYFFSTLENKSIHNLDQIKNLHKILLKTPIDITLWIKNIKLAISLEIPIKVIENTVNNYYLNVSSRDLQLTDFINNCLDQLNSTTDVLSLKTEITLNNSKQKKENKLLITEFHNQNCNILCKICMENDINITLLPCKHTLCCSFCVVRLKQCPICREPISQTVKIYLV